MWIVEVNFIQTSLKQLFTLQQQWNVVSAFRLSVYLLAKMLVYRNEHFQLVFRPKMTCVKIWALDSLIMVYRYVRVQLPSDANYRDMSRYTRVM
jgi:hypothetical protein